MSNIIQLEKVKLWPLLKKVQHSLNLHQHYAHLTRQYHHHYYVAFKGMALLFWGHLVPKEGGLAQPQN